MYKTYYANFLLLRFYCSELKIHSLPQAQSNQLMLQNSLFMATTAKEHGSHSARLRTWADTLLFDLSVLVEDTSQD